MKDRLLSGTVAGLAGGMAYLVWSYVSYFILHLARRLVFQWMAVILYGHFTNNIIESMFAGIVWLLWMGLLGAVYAYAIPSITSRNHLFRGAAFGFVTFLFIRALTLFFRLPGLTTLQVQSSASAFIGSQVFGLITAYILGRLDNSVNFKGPPTSE